MSKFENRLKNTPKLYLGSIVTYMDTLSVVNLWNDDHNNVLDSASMIELTKSIVKDFESIGE
jgi:hypothetical protein